MAIRQEYLDEQTRRWMRPDWRHWWKPGYESDPLYQEYERLERKFSPDQPRVPAGNREGGQWTSGDAGGDARQQSAAGRRAGVGVQPFLEKAKQLAASGKARIRGAPIFAILFWSGFNCLEATGTPSTFSNA